MDLCSGVVHNNYIFTNIHDIDFDLSASLKGKKLCY